MTSTPSDPNQPGSTPPPPPGGGATPPPPPGDGATPPPYSGQQGGYGQQQPGGYGQAEQPLSDSDQRLWATLAHAGGILFSFVAPLVVWLVFRARGRFVDEQAKEALNFQLTMLIAIVVGWLLTIVVIGVFILIAAYIMILVFGILAAVAVNKGEAYRYPVSIRMIK